MSRRTIRFLPILAVLAVAASIPASAVAPTNDGVVAWISAASHPLTMTDPNAPLDDLAALSTIVGRAEVVGLGEATPGSHEIWTLKHRMVQYLVRRLGFTAFVMETTAPIGRELDDYVLNDVGDPRTILSSFPWSCPEVVDVFVWMRTYNADRSHRWKLRIAGMELGLTTEDVDRVTGDVATAATDLVPVIRQAYAELRAAPRVTPFDRTAYSALPPATKARYGAQAQKVVDLLRNREGAVSGSSTGVFARALQGARLIRQLTHWMELLGTDPGAALAYHEQAMAENAGWWHDQVGKTIIWAHDAHVAKRAMAREPDSGKMMGSFLRARFADRYLSIGTSFGQGVYLAIQRTPAGEVTNRLMSVSLGPPAPTSRNAVLDQAGRDYLLDLRPAPAPIRAWLLESEPFEFGPAPALDDPKRPAANAYGSGPLGEWFDVLAHLRRVNAARDPTALAPAHRPVGQVLHTSVGEIRELRFADEFRYAGGQRFILKKAADAEQHFFVAADRAGTVRRVYWIQFESLLPGIGQGYDYSTDAAVTVYGVPFRRNTSRWERPPEPDSDRAAMFRFLAGRGYRIPDGAMRLRLVHVPEGNPREELMVVYVEVPEPGVAPPAEADVQRRAVEGLQVGAR